jgi:two-component system nitrogen regulation response regulator GlnG
VVQGVGRQLTAPGGPDTGAVRVDLLECRSGPLKNVWILDRTKEEARELVRALPSLAYHVDVWSDPGEFLEAFGEAKPDLVVLEHGIEEAKAVEMLRAIKEIERRLPIVVVAERTSSQGAIESMREGAYDYLPRETLPGGLEDAARRALSSDGRVIRTIGSPGPGDVDDLGAIVGRTPEMVEIHKLIGQLAATDAAVLIQGEPGTGKELIARAIHYNSDRRDRPFLAVNCSVLPDEALGAELFGWSSGGGEFGAGRFEQANKGTVFIDQIDQASLPTQSRILSVLESGEFERPKARSKARVDVRVVAATDRSLVQLMKEGQFRVDLFYRLKVVSVFIPPLRDRKPDIQFLAEHFLERAKSDMQRDIDGMSPDVVDLLNEYPWPGNVRELEHAIQRAVALNRTGVLAPEDFDIFEGDGPEWEETEAPMTGDLAASVRSAFRKHATAGSVDVDETIVSEVERVLAEEALERSGGNQVQAAKLLGISRNTLRKRLRGKTQ